MKALVLIGLIICFLETPVVFAEQTTVPSPTTIVKKPDWFKQPPANLPHNITTATRNNKQIILYFYQDSCPFCAKLLKHDFGNPDIANKTRQYFEVIPINMKGTKPVTDISGTVLNEADFAAEKDVLATPVLLFLDEAGTEVLRVNGYYPSPYTQVPKLM
ncbi:MAG: thioredoxin fold domain-containing protein [Candidatus Thiothrix putei]|uniref:Thioredoxin fold domain-containing protein n=1 Tax=Candidatus Thiothrix putei TaxID=3080811 RepID=A0AA95HDA5_9GAMM|nr:MAG: thioredoxin fold domain-containing protein [Candidatus Thiothrix putei]